MKIVAIVVAYQPQIAELYQNVCKTSIDVDHLVVYQNSELSTELKGKLTGLGNVSIIGEGVNVGIAAALNAGVAWATKNKCSHVLTLDQDSYFEHGHLNAFKQLVDENENRNIGIFCPNIKNFGKTLVAVSDAVSEVPDSITSGSIIPMSTFDVCGLFEEALFIDAVDYEFCYRANKRYGLLTIIFHSILLNHQVGYPTKIAFGFVTDNYSAFRTYFIVRNHTIIWRRYPELFQPHYKKTLIKIHIIYRVAKILLGERKKWEKLKAIFVGLIHGFFKKLN